MDSVIREVDVVVAKTKKEGDISLVFTNDKFYKFGNFLETHEEYDQKSIDGIYVLKNKKYETVPVESFSSFHKMVKSVL